MGAVLWQLTLAKDIWHLQGIENTLYHGFFVFVFFLFATILPHTPPQICIKQNQPVSITKPQDRFD